MRVLFVTNETGWPENTGYRMRIANIARALAAVGEVEWLVLSTDPATNPAAPPELGLRPQVARVHVRSRPATMLRWLLRREPWRIAAVDLRRTRAAVRAATNASPAPFDLVFTTHLDTDAIASASLGCATRARALDLDNVESAMISHELDSTGAAMSWARRRAKRIDRARWRTLELRALEANDVTFVCSEVDRARMVDRARVLPNGAPRPSDDYERAPAPDRPVLLFVGAMSYPPNVDAVEFFVDEVLPQVRLDLPDVEFRIVGRHAGDRVRALASRPNVTVVGAVDSVEPELAAAHVAVTPVRFGGGTRIKILEALAFAVPLVTTAVGCEGIALVPGVHALLADDAATMARACLELLHDADRARSVAAAGHQFVREHYDWATITTSLSATLAALVHERGDGVSRPAAAG